MKTLLLSLFLICTLTAFGQQKHDKKITVEIADTTSLTKRIARAFYEKGYTFETKDDDVGFFKTKPKEMEKYSPLQTITALIKDGKITFSSKVYFKGLADFDVEYTPSKMKSAFTEAWKEVATLAAQFGDKITYSK